MCGFCSSPGRELSYACKPLPAHRDSPDRDRTLHPMEPGAQGVTRMLPDLRFVIGAVLATALLGVTLFGLAATMHISHQSKIGPLEASRMLAYTPEGRHRIFDMPAPRFDSPFANIPADPNPVPLQQPAAPLAPPVQTAAVAQPAPIAQPTSTTAQPEPMATAQPEPMATAQPDPAAELTPVAQPANLPPPADDADTVDERAVIDPPLPLDNEPPAAPAAAASAPLPEPVAATAAPIETTPAAPAPVAEQPAVTPDVQQVGSIPTTNETAETRSDVPAVADEAEVQEPVKAKRKRARKAKRVVRRVPAPSDAFSTHATSNANRPAQGFWPFD